MDGTRLVAAATGVTLLKPGDDASYRGFGSGVGITAMAVDQTYAYFVANHFVGNDRYYFIARIQQEKLLKKP